MKIKLEYPYNEDWRCGYVVTNPEGRETIILYNNNRSRSSTQYARYLLSVHIGRYLKGDEQVDHIDGNKCNNTLSNLQVLTQVANNRKTHCKPLVTIPLCCPVCSKKFTRTDKQVSNRIAKANRNEICCSRRCGGIYSHKRCRTAEML